MKNNSANDRANPERQTRTKKPYKKPTFRRESVFETSALACGKIGATSAQCRNNRKNS